MKKITLLIISIFAIFWAHAQTPITPGGTITKRVYTKKIVGIDTTGLYTYSGKVEIDSALIFLRDGSIMSRAPYTKAQVDSIVAAGGAVPTLQQVLTAGNTATGNMYVDTGKFAKIQLYDSAIADFDGVIYNYDNKTSFKTQNNNIIRIEPDYEAIRLLTSDGIQSALDFRTYTSSRNWRFPDSTGTVALIEYLPAGGTDTPTINATIAKGQYPINNFMDLANVLNPDLSKTTIRPYNFYEDSVINGSTGNRYSRTPCVYMYNDTLYVTFVQGDRHAPTQGGHRLIRYKKSADGRYSTIINDVLIAPNNQAINYTLVGDTVFAWKKGMTTFTIDSLIKLNPRTLARIGTAIAFNHASVFLPTSTLAPGKFVVDDSGYFYAPVYKTSPKYVAYLLRSKNRGQTWALADSITSTVNVIRAEEPFAIQIKGDTMLWGVRSDVGNYIWTKKGFRGYNYTAATRACRGGNLPKAILSSTDSLLVLTPSRWYTKRVNQDEENVELNDTIDIGEYPAEVQTEDITAYTNIQISWDNGNTYYNFPLDKFRAEHAVSSQFASLWIPEGADVQQLGRDTFRIVFAGGAYESSSAVNQISDLSYTDFVINPRQPGVVKILGGLSAPRTTYYTNINAKTITLKDTGNFTTATQQLSNTTLNIAGNFKTLSLNSNRMLAINRTSVPNFWTHVIDDTLGRERLLLHGNSIRYQNAAQGGPFRLFSHGGTTDVPTQSLLAGGNVISMGGHDSSGLRNNFTIENYFTGNWNATNQTSRVGFKKTIQGGGQTEYYNHVIDSNNRHWFGNSITAPFALGALFTIESGTLTSGLKGFNFTATQPSSISAEQTAFDINVTGAGSSNQYNNAFRLNYLVGYTGASGAIAMQINNLNGGTGTNLRFGSTAIPTGNGAGYFSSFSGNTGINYGIWGEAGSSTTGSIGVISKAIVNSNAAYNIGLLSYARNTLGTQIGAHISLADTVPSFVTQSAALIVDNDNETSPIFLAQDNGDNVFRIDNGGAVHVYNRPVRSNTADSLAGFNPVTGQLVAIPNSYVKAIAKAYIDSSTGGISYVDTGVNPINTRTYLGGATYTLRLDSLKTTVYDAEKPLGVARFYRFSDSAISLDSSMWIDLLLYFKAQASTVNQEIDVWVDIGGSSGELYRETYYFRASGVDKAINYSLPASFSRTNFFNNGGKIKVYSTNDFTLTSNIVLNIDLDHRRLGTQ